MNNEHCPRNRAVLCDNTRDVLSLTENNDTITITIQQ